MSKRPRRNHAPAFKAKVAVAEARASIGRYVHFYNSRRPHSSLDRKTPDQAYFNRLPQIAAA
jgi:putative transposase